MSTEIRLRQNMALSNLLQYAEKVVTEDGNEYFKFPHWIQKIPEDFTLVIHHKAPEDLAKFITKARLGGDNPQPIKPEQ